jgi:hypothetical protein
MPVRLFVLAVVALGPASLLAVVAAVPLAPMAPDGRAEILQAETRPMAAAVAAVPMTAAAVRVQPLTT